MLDDDARLLLPAQQPNYDGGSEADWIASPTSSGCSIDMLAADESFSEYSSDSASPPCDLGTIERLLRTHPVWFLPDIQRAGAVHLLQSKEHGSFVVRGSSQVNTMAVSVRLPPGTGPYIEHYLIQSHQGVLSLETSKFKFDSIPALIAHYSQCCDELPVQLRLPKALREATNRKQLSSLSLLGQEFWRYSMTRTGPTSMISPGAAPGRHQPAVTSPTSPATNSAPCTDSAIDMKLTSPMSCDTANSSIKYISGAEAASGGDIQVTQFSANVQRRKPSQAASASNGNHNINNNNNNSNVHTIDLLSPTLANSFGTFCQIDTPSDTMSSISSFTSAGLHGIHSPTAAGELNGNQQQHPLRHHRMSLDLDRVFSNGATATDNSPTSAGHCVEYHRSASIRTRPTPPNTLNLICFEGASHTSAASKQPPRLAATPNNNSSATPAFHASAVSVFSPMRTSDSDTPLSSQAATTVSSASSSFGRAMPRDKQPSQTRHHHHHHHHHHKPKHYQESAILEYCRSPLADKISDYEDWSSTNQQTPSPQLPDTASTKIYQTTLSHGPLMSSFRAAALPQRTATPLLSPARPDLLHECRTVTSLSENVLQPVGSLGSSSSASSTSSASSISSLPASQAPPTHPPPALPSPTPSATAATSAPPAALALCSPQMVYVNPVNAATTLSPTDDGCKESSPFYAEPAYSLNNLPPLPQPLQPLAAAPTSTSARLHFQQPPPLIVQTAATPLPSPLDAAERLSQLCAVQQQPPRHVAGAMGAPKTVANIVALRAKDAWSLDSSWMFMNADGPESEDVEQTEQTNGDRPLDDGKAVPDLDYDTDEHWNTLHSSCTNTTTRPYPSSTAETAKLSGAGQQRRSQTVQQLILARMPELSAKLSGSWLSAAGLTGGRPTLCVDNSAALVKCFRISSYDNVTDRSQAGYKQSILQLARSGASSSVHSDDGTVFSEPWDSSQWDTFSLNQGDNSSATATPLPKSRVNTMCLSEGDTITEEETYPNTVIDNLADASTASTMASTASGAADQTSQSTLRPDAAGCSTMPAPAQKLATIMRSRNRLDRSVLNHPRNKQLTTMLGAGGLCGPTADTTANGAGATIADYAYSLANDSATTFARNIQNFITCTRESRELTPQVIMRNMRQFMSGMKNYLVKHGEGQFQAEVLRARSRLRADEFLNLDQILEGVMHRLVVLPLRQHLYALSVEHYVQAGQIQLLVENVRQAADRSAADFGIPASVEPPSPVAMQRIALLLQRLQESELPLDKLSYLLTVVAAIFETANSTDSEQAMGADYFLPLLVYVVAKCEFIGAEVEAEFMYGLLQQSLLTGEAGYYLTALCSAVEVLKGMMASRAGTAERRAGGAGSAGSVAGVGGAAGALATGKQDLNDNVAPLPPCSSVLRVIIPDELNGSLQTCTLPVRPNTTTKEVCRSIAHKARITNPQDYALFELIDGEETLMTDADCPQESRLAARGQHCLFAYKRIEAKIAWPTQSQPPHV